MSVTLYRAIRRSSVLAAGLTVLAVATAMPSSAPAQTGSLRVSFSAPNAASLGKFGDVPVSLYTGIPDITVPLFTAQGRTLSLPISLKYHAGGIRVADIASWVGLGWSLEAGGAITRTVRGLIDDTPAGYHNTGHVWYDEQNWTDPPASLRLALAQKGVDPEPDQFFFSFAGRSGEFVIGPASTSPTIKEYRAIPHQKLRIEPVFDGQIISWIITTEDGTRYTFSARETTLDYNWVNLSPGGHFGEPFTSTWHLTGIRSPGGDSISLSYTPYSTVHEQSSFTEEFHQRSPAQCAPAGLTVFNRSDITNQRLTSITTARHTITFSPGSSLRTDATYQGIPQEPRLDKITVATPAGSVLRVFQLEHDYFPGNRLRLTNVYEQDRNGSSLPPYTFTYDSQTLPDRTSHAQDHWGFYNGKPNSSLIPSAIAPNGQYFAGADRTPDPNVMQAGVLTRITYPTGGYNEFAYEANDYGGIGLMSDPPMVSQWRQVVAIMEPPQTNVATPFTVNGASAVNANVNVMQNPAPPDCQPVGWPSCPRTQIDEYGWWTDAFANHQVVLNPGNYTARAYEPMPSGSGSAQIIVTWTEHVAGKRKTAGGLRVGQVTTADAMGNVSVRKYKYRLQSDTARSSGMVSAEPSYTHSHTASGCSYFSRSAQARVSLGGGPAVGYSEVTVWHGANGEHGKTRHTFRSVQNAVDVADHGTVPHSRGTSREWMRGQPLQVSEYSATGQIQRRSVSTYILDDLADSVVRSFRGLSFHDPSNGDSEYHFLSTGYEVVSGLAYKTVDSTIVYDTTGTSSFSGARSYTYGNLNHLQLTQEIETNSDGVQRITRWKYPADFATGSGNPEAVALTAMQGAAHMHSPVIEQWVTQRIGVADSVVGAELTSYKEYAPGQFAPYQRFALNSPSPIANFVSSSVAGGTFTRDSRYLLQETANSYDPHGRITQLADARGKLTDYLYGGNSNDAFLTKVTRVKDASGLIDLATELAYDSLGFLHSMKDEGGSLRRFAYDLFGRLRQIRNHSDSVVQAFGYTFSRTSPSWTFNAASPNAVVDSTFLHHSPTPKSVVSTQFVDGLGRPIQTVVQDGSSFIVTANQYDAMGRPWRVWKPYARTTAGYDANFTASATGFYNTYHSASNAKPYVETQYRPDALGRLSKVIPEYLGTSPTVISTHSYGIDAAAKHAIAEIADASGKKTRSFSDIFGNEVKTLLGVGKPEATTTLTTFDVAGQRIKTTDPRGLITTYLTDTRGLLISKTSPDAGAVASKYDKNSTLRYSQDANQAALGTVHFMTYDFASRPLKSGLGAAVFASLDPDAASPPALETAPANWLTVRAYDAKPSPDTLPWSLFSAEITPLTLANVSGRLAAVASKSNGAWQATLFSYDADGRLATSYTFTQANGGGSVLAALNTQVQYVRDLRDIVTQRRLTVGSTTFNHWYEFDNRGLLWKVFASTDVTKPANPDVTFSYRPTGQLQDRQFQGGPLVPHRYTIREELQTIGDPALTTYPFSARYAYHKNGTMSETEFYSGGSPATQKRYRYQFDTTSYDALNRLRKADFSGWNGGAWTTTLAHDLTNIAYDASGNLTTLQRYRETATLIDNLTYAYPGSSNRLSSVSEAVGTTAESWDAEAGAFTYDANGNVLTAPAPYAISAVSYDHQNLPISLTSNGVATSYRYDGAGQRIAKQVGAGGNTEIYVRDGASTLGVVTVNGSGAPTAWFFNVLAGDRAVGRQPSVGNRKYYHADLLGSTRAVAEGAAIVESYDPEPWGLLMPGRTLGSGTKEGFTGKERDAESGLSYFGARLYMPALGRWTGIDPLAEKHPEWSPYNYVLNNPLVLVDPDGQQVDAIRRFYAGVWAAEWRVAKGTVSGVWNTVRHPIATAKGVAALVTDPEVRSAAKTAIVEGVADRLDKLQSGDAYSVGEVVGEAAAVVGEVVLGAVVSGGASHVALGSSGAQALGRSSRVVRAARLAADEAQAKGAPPPGASGVLETAAGTVKELSGQKAKDPRVQNALDNVKKPSGTHGKCAEINCISKALSEGIDPRGGTMAVVRITERGKRRHGEVMPPCSSCKEVMEEFQITPVYQDPR